MSQSPLEADNAGEQVDEYLDNWNAVATRIREGASFSGREPNCCFLNTAGPRFADISAAVGLDYPDDGRGVAICDWDLDGDVDLWISNRTGPSVRLLRNELNPDHHFVALLLEGTECNRDAIGARIEVVMAGDTSPRIKTLRAGEGFLSQSSKWVHFGLGKESAIEQVRIRWPGRSDADVYRGLSADRRYRIKQGGRPEPLADVRAERSTSPPTAVSSDSTLPAAFPATEAASSPAARTVLTQRRPLPPLTGMSTFDGAPVDWQAPTRPTLFILWASWCRPCLTELTELAQHAASPALRELDVLACNVDSVSESGDEELARRFADELQAPFRWVRASTQTAAELTHWQHERFYRQLPLPLPCSYLLDRRGRVAVIYQGPVALERLMADMELLDASGQVIQQAALPAGGRNVVTWFSPDPVRIAAAWLEGDYLDEAERELLQIVGPSSGSSRAVRPPTPEERNEAWQMLAQIARRRGDAESERAAWRSLVESNPDRFDFALQQVMALVRHGRRAEADALLAKLESRADSSAATHELPLLLGQVFLQLGQYEKSLACFQRALERRPEDLESRFGLAMALQACGERTAAVALYRKLLEERPEMHMAANNLAWLLAVGSDADDASRQEAIALAGTICTATGRSNASYLDTLAVALAEAGQWQQAEATLREALQVARSRGEASMVEKLTDRLGSIQRQRIEW